MSQAKSDFEDKLVNQVKDNPKRFWLPMTFTRFDCLTWNVVIIIDLFSMELYTCEQE
jgi:hypothetical protein